jgi:hypothetical protein
LLLHRLGTVAVVSSLLALCLWLPALLGVGLGACVWLIAARDLARMDAGLMDPSGRPATREARVFGQIAVLLGAPYLVRCSVIFWPLLRDIAWSRWGDK